MLRPEYLQAESVERFSLEPVIEDLARTADRATATFALRRLEYRSGSMQLEGASFPIRTVFVAFSLSLAGVLLVAGTAAWAARARV